MREFVASVAASISRGEEPVPIQHEARSGTTFFLHKSGDVFVVAASLHNPLAVPIFDFVAKLCASIATHTRCPDGQLRAAKARVQQSSREGARHMQPAHALQIRGNLPLLFTLLDESLDYGLPQVVREDLIRDLVQGRGCAARSRGIREVK